MDEMIDALGSLIHELQEDEAMIDQTWRCHGCGMTHVGNAVTPTKTVVGETGVHTFCVRCAPGVVAVREIVEKVPLKELLGCKPRVWPPPEASTQSCPECGEPGAVTVMHKSDPDLALYTCCGGHEWEINLRDIFDEQAEQEE